MALTDYKLRTGTAELDGILNGLIGVFMRPGEIMLASLNATPWGKGWALHGWEIAAMFALLFWCVLYWLVSSATIQIDRFLKRNEPNP